MKWILTLIMVAGCAGADGGGDADGCAGAAGGVVDPIAEQDAMYVCGEIARCDGLEFLTYNDCVVLTLATETGPDITTCADCIEGTDCSTQHYCAKACGE